MRQHSEEGRTRPPLLVAIRLKLFRPTVPVARFGRTLFLEYTKAVASLLLGTPSLAGRPSFAT